MTSHRRRFLLAIPAALCLALSASPGALAASGDTKADYPGTGEPPAGNVGTHHPVATQAPRAGDTPVDYPSATRAPQYVRATSERPRPTIARDGDPTLAISLGISALVLAGFAVALGRTRMQPRPSRS
jgi:hypothetical protein